MIPLPEMETDRPQSFDTTHWTMIVQAGNSRALEELCQIYWYPLYVYVRRCGEDPEQSKDLTQGFFAELLEKNLVSTADRNRGKFRWFLLASFKHFLARQWQRARAQKRGGNTMTIKLDALEAEERYRLEPSDDLSPDIIYERRWAHTLIQRANDELSREYQEERFALLKQFLPGQEPEISYREVASHLGISEGSVKVEVHRMRKNFGNALRNEVAKTVDSPDQVDGEVRHLIDALFRK